MTRIVSWNVNGLRAVLGKGFDDIVRSLDADIICLNETKLQAGQTDYRPEGYHCYWNYAERKGYSGVAVFTRREPLGEPVCGIGTDEHDHEGRTLTLDMGAYYLVAVYVPNSGEGLRRLDYRMRWEDDFRAYLQRLDKEKPVVVCGDLNVAHENIDIKNPAANRHNSGFTDEERGKFGELLAAGFADTFRELHPDEQTFSWWSYRFRARERNAGWRIDYFLVSRRLMPQVARATIHTGIMGSDHCPVELALE